MEALWAPWRMQYIQAIGKKEEGCVFCNTLAETKDRENLILYRGASCFIVMNLYPYNNGHLLVIPNRHVADLSLIDKRTSDELWELLCLARNALSEAFHPDGFNIGMNLGHIAGAGIDKHLHLHIVPRWNGDTNFMPVIGEVKVVSQSLRDAYDALLPHVQGPGGTSSGSAPAR